MFRNALVLTVAFAMVFAGCLSGSPEGEVDAATAKTEEAPSALNESKPYRVASEGKTEATAYPYRLGSGEPKAPETLTYEGEFKPEDCGLDPAGMGESQRMHDFSQVLDAGDVFLVRATLTFTNTDANWGDIRAMLWVPGQGASYSEYAGGMRGEITEEIEAQSAWRGDENQVAWFVVACWWGQMTEPIAYTATVEVTFVRDAAPVGVPVGLEVPEGATHLYFSGKAIDPADEVTAHWRLFDPADAFVGEGFFGLTPDEPVTAIPVGGAGEYVLYVEHVENGFLAAATNVQPAEGAMRLLEITWHYEPILQVDHGSDVDELLTFDLARMPLALYAWTDVHEDGTAVVDNADIVIDSPLGTLLTYEQGAYWRVRTYDPVPFGMGFWLPSLNGAWDWSYDHHALSPGTHTLHLTADKFHGRVYYVMSTYLRTGESDIPAPGFSGGGSDDLAAGALEAGRI